MNETAVSILISVLMVLVIICIAISVNAHERLTKVEERNNQFKLATNNVLGDLLKITNNLTKRVDLVTKDIWKAWRYEMNNKESKPMEPKFEKTADMDDPSVPKEVQDKEKAKDLLGITDSTKCANPYCKCTKVPLFKEMYDK